MRHVLPVDRRARPREVAGDGEAHAVSGLLLALAEPRGGHYLFCAFLEPARGDAQPVDGPRVGLDEVASFQLHRVDAQVVRDLLQVELQREPRLWRAVAALGSARGLVREDSAA